MTSEEEYARTRQEAAQALEAAHRAERECDGYEWRLVFWLGCALVHAVLAVAAGVRQHPRA